MPAADDPSANEFRRLEELFHELVDADDESRKGRLAEIEVSEPRLRVQLEELLRAARRSPAETVGRRQPEERIGPFLLHEYLGEGGMGVVYRATQEEPLRREVALKLMRPGLLTRDLLARFETERQALALMSHPGIAKALDAGTTEQGEPYFVMEYVPGEPITTFCDRQRLSIGERIELVIAACEAVQHAHQKGVLHRDLKPSNLLVTSANGRPAVRVIDFGIAKVLEGPLAERSFRTLHGAFLGTPEYMSPEQAAGDAAAVDARSDIYGLGVILYELLVGARPFDFGVENDSRPLDVVLRSIREDDPPTLSRRFSELDGERREEVARSRQLAEDLRRYIAHKTVAVGPPSHWYRRNRPDESRATLERAVAILRAREESEPLALARALQNLSITLLRQPDPAGARQAAEEAEQRLEEGLGTDHPDHAAALSDLAVIYYETGDVDAAAAAFRRVNEIRERVLGPDHPHLAESINNLALIEQERGRPEVAAALFERALSILAERPGPSSPYYSLALDNLGRLVHQQGDSERAEGLLREALALRRRYRGDEDPEVGETLTHLAQVLLDRGSLVEARRLAENALVIFEGALGPQHPVSWESRAVLADVLALQGNAEGARRQYEIAHATLEAAMPPAGSALVTCRRRFAELLLRQGDVAAGRTLLEQIVAALENQPDPSLELERARELLRATETTAGAR